MSAKPAKEPFRIVLTESQKSQIREALGRDDVDFDLEIMQLEDRIVPKLAANHNEPVLQAR